MANTGGRPQLTPLAVLFDTTDDPPRMTAEHALRPHLGRDLGALANLPEPVRKAAIGAVIAATVELLDFNMIELLVDGWREHHDLTEAAHRTLAKPGATELVALATHRITVARQPSVDVMLDGQLVTTINFELTLQFEISAAVAEVSKGMIIALHSGRCDITVTLAVQGAEAFEKQKRIELPGVISLNQGIRLLDERDYAATPEIPAAAKADPAAAMPS